MYTHMYIHTHNYVYAYTWLIIYIYKINCIYLLIVEAEAIKSRGENKWLFLGFESEQVSTRQK